MGLTVEGKKGVLGVVRVERKLELLNERIKDLRTRGVEDILITATDNLKRFTKTMRAVFPESQTQICVVHQIRNASRYIVWEDKKELTADIMTQIESIKFSFKKKTQPYFKIAFFCAVWTGLNLYSSLNIIKHLIC